MIAKIGRGTSLYGALAYNQTKVTLEKAEIIHTNRIIETPDGSYTVAQMVKSFEPYLTANRNTEKPAIHISLNPDPKDQVSDEQYIAIAQDYMREMGYGDQPFIVFKHTDIDRSHIHIVSVCIDEFGKKISDQFERKRSMQVCRDMEKVYKLVPATEQKASAHSKEFQVVDYKKGDLKSQIASVVRRINRHYRFQTLGEYNALLSLFKITAEKVEADRNGVMRKGLLYHALNEQGETTGQPFKASLFGKNAGIYFLEEQFTKGKELMKDKALMEQLKNTITKMAEAGLSEIDFKNRLATEGIDVMIRKNEDGRIYGITFIDHRSKTVWNGSRLGKEFSANTFQERWNTKKKIKEPTSRKAKRKASQHRRPFFKNKSYQPSRSADHEKYTDRSEDSWIEALGGWMPAVEHLDYQEPGLIQFLKKKKGRRRKHS